MTPRRLHRLHVADACAYPMCERVAAVDVDVYLNGKLIETLPACSLHVADVRVSSAHLTHVERARGG